MKSRLLAGFTTAAITLSTFVVVTMSCSKGKTDTTPIVNPPLTDSNAYVEDYAISEMVIADAIRNADRSQDISSGGSMGFRTTAGCAAIVTSNLDSTVIDFGSTNCLGVDSRNRRGKITIVHTGGHYNDSNASHVIYMDNYFVSDHRSTGSVTVKNKGRNSFGQPTYTHTINTVITRSNGTSIVVNEIRNRTWSGGYDTQTDRSDDVYQDWTSGNSSITRTVSGVSSTIQTNISNFSPLVIAFNCVWIKSGTVSFTLPSGAADRKLNYGDAPACDNQGTVELPLGVKIPFTLP